MLRPLRPPHLTALTCAIAGITALASTPLLATPPAPDAGPVADCLFDWAETRYPALFSPPGAASRIRDGAYYRDYPGSGMRLAAASGRVWLLAPGAISPAEAGSVREWLAGSGCSEADSTPPYVLFTSRSNGAVEVVRNARLAVAFSEPVTAAGAWGEAFTVTRDDGRRVQGSVHYDEAQATLHFVPAGDLEGGRSYTAAVSTAVRDLAGNPLAAAHSWQFSTTSAAQRNNELQHQLQFVLDRALWRNAIPGATMAVLGSDGSLWTAASGHADITTRSPMREDLLLRIGSNTKTFVGTAVLKLVDEGRVQLDAPINTWIGNEMRSYLPAYDGNRITVRQLLQHNSGIFNFTADPQWGEAFVSDPTKRYFPQELLMIANRNVNASTYREPGSGFSYSNTNYVLLGLLLGHAGGLVYDDAIRLGITTPLGLTQTLVPAIGDAVPPPKTSRGYWEDTETRTLHDVTIKDPSTVWSSGDMIADISDLARWGRALGQGALISPAAQAQRLTWVDMSPSLQYGLGIVRDRNANLLGHQGGIIGYTSQMYYVPEQNATLAFFYNRTLAMPDYSAVMTYDALRLLWPDRYRWLPSLNPVAGAVQTHRAALDASRPAGRVHGFLNEY